MDKKSKASKATHTKLPKGHAAYNLPDPSGGAFQGAQLTQPGPMGPLPPGQAMPPGSPMQGE